jgi:hypothetical protein
MITGQGNGQGGRVPGHHVGALGRFRQEEVHHDERVQLVERRGDLPVVGGATP